LLLDYIDKTEVINADAADDIGFIGISKQVCCQSYAKVYLLIVRNVGSSKLWKRTTVTIMPQKVLTF